MSYARLHLAIFSLRQHSGEACSTGTLKLAQPFRSGIIGHQRIMQRIHILPLADEELRQQLEAGATIIFEGQTVQWHEIERQVERLGFGNLYVVSATQGPPGDNSKISLKPEH